RGACRSASCPTSQRVEFVSASLLRTCVDRAHGLDGVRLGGWLVGAIALHAGKAERDPAWVARARLDAVEGDLDDELGADVDDVTLSARLQLEEVLGLPGEHLVRH